MIIMKCKKCGAILLDNDTFCSECGTRVKMDMCPKCGETVREGSKFCFKCGYEIGKYIDSNVILEDDEIPVTGQLSTTEIPFDVIEKNILLEAARQAHENDVDDVPVVKEKKVNRTNIEYEPEYVEEEEYSENESDYEEYDNYEEYNDAYDDNYDEEYYEEDEYDESEYGDVVVEKSLLSRLFTAGIIVIGLIIILIIAYLFFDNRNSKKSSDNTNIEETTSENEEENIVNDGLIGTITIIEDVNIRDNPSTDNTMKIGVARSGEQYGYYGFAEGTTNWVHIKVDESTDGYVYKDYISIDD